MTEPRAPRMVGINHVALEVGDVEAAVEFYRSIFDIDLRGRSNASAFLDMGDQFLALSEVDDDADERDDHRHVGLVIDDVDALERRLDEEGVEVVPDQAPDFRDPWGNYLQIVAHEDVQFTKAGHVLRGMGLSDLEKSEDAIAELAEKGMAPE